MKGGWGMDEFTIFYAYKNTSRRACVLKSKYVKMIEYNVRPVDPMIVREFGPQIKIFWFQGNYSIHNLIAVQDRLFYCSLINGIDDFVNDHINRHQKNRIRASDAIRNSGKGGSPGVRPGM